MLGYCILAARLDGCIISLGAVGRPEVGILAVDGILLRYLGNSHDQDAWFLYRENQTTVHCYQRGPHADQLETIVNRKRNLSTSASSSTGVARRSFHETWSGGFAYSLPHQGVAEVSKHLDLFRR